jgi:phage FluMu gp28-like protein
LTLDGVEFDMTGNRKTLKDADGIEYGSRMITLIEVVRHVV